MSKHSDTPLRSSLHDKHCILEARFGLEGGWEMPLTYGNLIAEVNAVRLRAGAMDRSNCGRLRISGDDALSLLEKVCTADVAHQEDQTAIATCLCNERGGIIDLCTLMRLEDSWLMVTSPDGRQQVHEHLKQQADGLSVKLPDETLKTTQIAIAGPAAAAFLDKMLPAEKPSTMHTGCVREGSVLIAKYAAARVDCFGEWCLDVILGNLIAGRAWEYVTARAGENSLQPVGQLAAEVLRLEAGEVRFGHEINQTIDPFTAGMEHAIDLNHDFIGRDALARLKTKSPQRKRVGLVVDDEHALLIAREGAGQRADFAQPQSLLPRQGQPILREDGSECGSITSGGYSVTMDRVIAMGYVTHDVAEAGQRVSIAQPNGQSLSATITSLPFTA